MLEDGYVLHDVTIDKTDDSVLEVLQGMHERVFTGTPGAFAQDGRELRTKVLARESVNL